MCDNWKVVNRVHKYKNKSRNNYSKILNENYYKSRNKYKNTVTKTIVQNLDLNIVKPRRAGVIIYTVHNEITYFGLALDSRTHDLTDFGGTIIYKIDKNVITGALREFEEETLNIFETITFEDIKSYPVIYDKNNLIIFIHLNIDPDLISKSFNEKYKSVINSEIPEVCSITWLTWPEFQHSIIQRGIIYFRVQKFLNRAGDFSDLL